MCESAPVFCSHSPCSVLSTGSTDLNPANTQPIVPLASTLHNPTVRFDSPPLVSRPVDSNPSCSDPLVEFTAAASPANLPISKTQLLPVPPVGTGDKPVSAPKTNMLFDYVTHVFTIVLAFFDTVNFDLCYKVFNSVQSGGPDLLVAVFRLVAILMFVGQCGISSSIRRSIPYKYFVNTIRHPALDNSATNVAQCLY